MDKKTKKQWVAALRSGEYKQGSGKLRQQAVDDNGDYTAAKQEFCCLGVLCDLVEPNQWMQKEHSWANGRSGNPDDTGMPRDGLQKKLGLDKPASRSNGSNTIAEKLAQLNDDGHTFEEIANWIEERTF